MCISTVSLMELIYGAEKSTQPDRNLRDVEAFALATENSPLRSQSGHAHRKHTGYAGQSRHAHRAI